MSASAEVSDTLQQGFILILSIRYKTFFSEQRDSSDERSELTESVELIKLLEEKHDFHLCSY